MSQKKLALGDQLRDAEASAEATAAKVRALRNQLAEYREIARNPGSDPLKNVMAVMGQKQVQEQLSEAEQLLQSQTSAVAELKAKYDAAAQSVSEQEKRLAQCTKEASKLSKIVSLGRFANGVAALGGKVKDTVGAGVSKIKAGIKERASASRDKIGETLKNATSGFKNGLKSMLLYGAGIRGLFALFNKLREHISSAVTEFAKSDAETQTTISTLKAALTGLKASWGAAFAPILNAVAPILQRLIAMLNTAAQAIAQFMAVLTGRGSFKKAVNSTGQLADNLGGAAGNAKEAKKQLMGIDTLTVAQDTDSGGGGGGGGGATAFEETAVDAESLPAKIAAALKAGEWAQAATILTDKLNEMVASVDWAGIGSKVGYYLDGALTFLATALTGFNWMALGGYLATGINNIITSVDWRNLGTLFTAKFRIILLSAAGFLQNLDMAALAQAFSDFAIGFFNGITDAISQVDWQLLGQQIAILISSLDWAGVFESLCAALGAALGGLFAFLKGLIGDAWNNLVAWWRETAYEDGQFTMEGLLDGIGAAWSTVKEWVKEHIFRPFMDAFKGVFQIGSPSKVMQEMGGYLMAGLKQGITNRIESVISTFGTVKSRITSSLQSLVTVARGINWSDIGVNIVNGIITGLNNGWQWLVNAVQNICSGLLNTAKSILGIHSPSKVFRDIIGQNIGEGIAVGIERSEGEAIGQVRELSAGLIAEINGFEPFSLASRFANMTLPPMPAVAGGFVAPPNAFSSSSYGGISPELESKLDALLDRLSGGNVGKIEPSDVYLDKRKVGEIMYTYTEERNRGRGK